MSCGPFRSAEDYRDHLPCEACEPRPAPHAPFHVIRNGIAITAGGKVISIKRKFEGLQNNCVVFGADELDDMIEALVELREKIDPRAHKAVEWQEIAADMIREGKVKEAVPTILDNSRDKWPGALVFIGHPSKTTIKGVSVSLQNNTPIPKRVWVAIANAPDEVPPPVLCVNCRIDPDPRGWSACADCRSLNP